MSPVNPFCLKHAAYSVLFANCISHHLFSLMFGGTQKNSIWPASAAAGHFGNGMSSVSIETGLA